MADTLSKAVITLDELIALNDEIAALARAGVPLDRGLRSLGGELPGRLGKFCTQLSEELARGVSLVDALGSSTSHFPRAYRAVVEAGVASGRLPAALESLASSLRRLAETRRSIVLTLIYPVLLFLVVWQLLVFSTTTIAPAIAHSFQAYHLPGGQFFEPLARLGASARYWGPGVPAAVLLLAAIWWLAGRGASAMQHHWAMVLFGWIPWFGRMFKLSITAVFVEVLKLLLENRVPLDQAARLAAEVTGDRRLIDMAIRWAEAIRRGEPGAIANLPGLPPLLRWLVAGFQQNEALLPALQNAADDYQRRAQFQAEKARVMLPIFVTCAFGAVISVAYTLTVYAPYVSLLKFLSKS